MATIGSEQEIQKGDPNGPRPNPPAGGTAPPGPSRVDLWKRRLRGAARRILLAAAAIAIAGFAYIRWESTRPAPLPDGFVATNGRIEGTEVDIAAKQEGRVVEILVHEGDFVSAGQVVARMDTDVLMAQLKEAEAKQRESKSAVEAALSNVKQREMEKAAKEAVVAQRNAELEAESRHFARAERLAARGAETADNLDSFRVAFLGAKATLAASQAELAAADAALASAKSQVVYTEASVDSAKAGIERIQADINDCILKAPRDGRVQYRVAEPGEVLSSGGKVLNMVDLTDVYMTFFLPTEEAGRVRQGTEVHLVLDAYPQAVIPARATFVADVAQFTPKTVETAVERQKLTFRIKAHIEKDLLKKYIRRVKTGLPGMAYVRLDPKAEWPEHLKVRIPND
ncbi:HlyD family secretion protein [Tundrisphaera sp. TA3]|uniref:HlyD family secretion protein n=1 Tax=Tundrisphaera sp. TA3 TaxID=3435775 RepID=UPI003EBC2333